MEKEQNHYKTLGVDKDADTGEIKHAYRAAVMKHHPDSQTGDSDAFRSVREAYEVLSDTGIHVEVSPSMQYSAGENEYSVRGGRFREPFGGSFGGVFNKFFGESVRGRELSLKVLLTREEASTGGEVPVEVPLGTLCPDVWAGVALHVLAAATLVPPLLFP